MAEKQSLVERGGELVPRSDFPFDAGEQRKDPMEAEIELRKTFQVSEKPPTRSFGVMAGLI